MMDASAVFSCILLLLTARCSFALLSSPSGSNSYPKTFRQQLKRGRKKAYTSLNDMKLNNIRREVKNDEEKRKQDADRIWITQLFSDMRVNEEMNEICDNWLDAYNVKDWK